MNENLIFIDTIYNPRPGDFSKLNKYCPIGRYSLGQWYNCRELFHNHLANCKIFFFSYEEGKYNSIIKFMKKAEEILKIEVKSEFGPTQRKDVIWIKPSKWWTCSSMRRSFLTILLRSSLNYSFFKDNFFEAIFLEKYFSETRYATERFFSGFTKYTGRKRGWYKQFFKLKPSEKLIDYLLIKP